MKMSIPELQALSVANRNAGVKMSPAEMEAAIAATLAKGLKLTPQGRVQVQVTSKLLPKGRAYRNFDCPYEAAAFKFHCDEALSKGVIPPVLIDESAGNTLPGERPKMAELITLSKVIATRKTVKGLKDHDLQYLTTLEGEVGATLLEQVTEEWGLEWVTSMKAKKLKPGTIRKKVEALARAIESYYKATIKDPKDRPRCALRELEGDYSIYTEEDLEDGEDIEDEERHIRLPEGKDEEIEALIKGDYWLIPKGGRGCYRGAYRMNDRDDMLHAYRLLVWGGLRLGEMYRLQIGDLELAKCKVNINKKRTKKGYSRPVPLRGWQARELAEYVKNRHGDSPNPEARVFPFMGPVDSKMAMKKCSMRLTQRFRSLFNAVGLQDFRAHDLRHEGISRMMEWKRPDGSYMFTRAEEVMVFSGHRSMKMFRIYWNMREHDFSALPEDLSFS